MVDTQDVLIAIRRGHAETGVPEMRQEPQSYPGDRIGLERRSRQRGQAPDLASVAQGMKCWLHRHSIVLQHGRAIWAGERRRLQPKALQSSERYSRRRDREVAPARAPRACAAVTPARTPARLAPPGGGTPPSWSRMHPGAASAAAASTRAVAPPWPPPRPALPPPAPDQFRTANRRGSHPRPD